MDAKGKGKGKAATQFKKGHAGGPGRPPVPEPIRQARKLNQMDLEAAISKIAYMSPKEVQAAAKAGEFNMLEAAVAGQFLAGAKGKSTPIDKMFDRAPGIGPVLKRIKVEDDMSTRLENLTDEEKRRRIAELEKDLG